MMISTHKRAPNQYILFGDCVKDVLNALDVARFLSMRYKIDDPKPMLNCAAVIAI